MNILRDRGSLLRAATLLLALFSSLRTDGAALVSHSDLTNVAGAGNSFAANISSDGNIVVFLSEAPNLTAEAARQPFMNVFARNMASQTTTLVSAAGTDGANGISLAPSISSNGQWIAFQSRASNLVSHDTNGDDDVFLRNLATSTTVLVSTRPESPAASGNGWSRCPKISRNGQYVAFETLASDLVPNDTNETNDVVIRDLQTATTTLVSINTNGQSAAGESFSPSVSWQGSVVAFVSRANDIVPGAANPQGEIFVRNMETEITVWASAGVRTFFSGTAYACLNPEISGDGSAVVFKAAPSGTTSQSSALVFHYSMTNQQLTLIASNSLVRTFPQISADGNFIAY